MKTFINASNKIVAFLIAFFFSVAAVAQEKSVDININKDNGSSNWYTNPIVWIIGGAVFILLLVALLRGNSNKN
ncbi:MAG: hypothetical protein ABIN57_09790 [Chitinophagaceae bacterium]